MKVILFGKNNFAGVINLKIPRGDHPRFRMDPKSNDRYFYMREEEGDLRHNDT